MSEGPAVAVPGLPGRARAGRVPRPRSRDVFMAVLVLLALPAWSAPSAAQDAQTVAIYDFADGAARYLHTNCRIHPRVA